MPVPILQAVLEGAGKSPTLAKLDSMARQVTGFGLSVIIPDENLLIAIRPAGQAPERPRFCHLIRTTEEGRKFCAACHSLMAFGACTLGVSEHNCYGGVTVMAACVHDAHGDLSGSAVVSSCDFTRGNRSEGWTAARAKAKTLPMDLRKLKEAYYDLPYLNAPQRKRLETIVDLAATALGEVLTNAKTVAEQTTRISTSAEKKLISNLILSRDKAFAGKGKPAGLPLIETVVSVVSRYPGMRLSVMDIAHAAHITPNHFSMLFRKHTGKTFVRFLLEKRLSRAEELLRDPAFNIAEIADGAGFDDPGYFARQFKKKTGVTPREWREAL